jgi:hypothetical protein
MKLKLITILICIVLSFSILRRSKVKKGGHDLACEVYNDDSDYSPCYQDMTILREYETHQLIQQQIQQGRLKRVAKNGIYNLKF